MPPTYSQNKVHIYKWRENNENWQRQLELNKPVKKRYYDWKKIQKIYFNILLEI
jgi:hypothetical protein